MYPLILLIHIFAAVCVIALVLIQQGKGATMGAAFGSGASQTVFGSRGSGSFLFRVTMTLIAIFFISSIGLNYLLTNVYKQTRVITLPANPPMGAGTGNVVVPTNSIDTNQTNSTNTMGSVTPGEIPISSIPKH